MRKVRRLSALRKKLPSVTTNSPGLDTSAYRLGARSHSDQDFTIPPRWVDQTSAPVREVVSSDALAFVLLSPTGVKPRWRVVVVDDHIPSKVAVAEAVECVGGAIVGDGASAAEAPALVERCRPDVVILAVGLPDGDGVDAAHEVMTRAPCPIVLLTSRTDAAVIERARAAGVMAFLLKPLRAEELGPALDLAVARFREFEALRKENADLKRAIESRKLVERAKGLLMEREGLSESEAFRRIQKASMDRRKSMAEVAEAILLAAIVGRPSPPSD